MDLKRAALTGAIWTIFESVGIQAMSFVLFLAFARLIDPHAFGVIQIAVTVLGLLQLFVEQGFSVTIVQRRELSRAMLDTAFWISVASGVAISVALLACAGLLASAYQSPELAGVLRVLAFSLPLAATCSVPLALFTRVLDFRPQALRRLIAVLGGGVVGVAMAFAGYGVWSLVGRLVVETVLDVLVVWRASEYRPGFALSRPEAGKLFSFGSRVAGSNLIAYLNRRADDLLIGFVLGPVALGYYAVAFRAMLLVSEVALRSSQRTAVPVFSELQNDPPRLRKAYYAAIEFAAAIGCPVFVGLSATAPELCLTLFGPQWAAAVPAMQALGLAGIGLSVSMYTGPLLIAVGKPNWFFKLNLVTALVNVAAALIAVRWGILAMAIGYVVRGYLLLPVAFVLAQRAIEADTARVLRLMFAPSFAALVMAGAVELVRRNLTLPPAPALFVLVVAGAATYIGLMALLARPTIDRLIDLLRMTRGLRRA